MLEDGERALIFLKYLTHSNRYYQAVQRGHFTLLNIDGEKNAVANWRLGLGDTATWQPKYLRESAFLIDTSRPWQVAMPFALLEKHLLEELSLLQEK
jgi:hypothetical protein